VGLLVPAPVLLFVRGQISIAFATLALALLARELTGILVQGPKVLVVRAVNVHADPPPLR